MTFHPTSAFFVLPIMLVLLELGRLFRSRPNAPSESKAIESTVFALFGLLLAFTFSGAVTRFDTHRKLVVDETNGIATAYLRLDLLPPDAQPTLRHLFRDYTTSRLHLYDGVSDGLSPESQRLQREIWKQAIAVASTPGKGADASRLLLPAINAMIEITAVRQNTFNMHPPPVVFLLLFAFSGGAAFLAGYSMTSGRSWFHMFALAVAVTLTIYATLEIEFPREGLIRLTNTDKTLIELRNSMN